MTVITADADAHTAQVAMLTTGSPEFALWAALLPPDARQMLASGLGVEFVVGLLPQLNYMGRVTALMELLVAEQITTARVDALLLHCESARRYYDLASTAAAFAVNALAMGGVSKHVTPTLVARLGDGAVIDLEPGKFLIRGEVSTLALLIMLAAYRLGGGTGETIGTERAYRAPALAVRVLIELLAGQVDSVDLIKFCR